MEGLCFMDEFEQLYGKTKRQLCKDLYSVLDVLVEVRRQDLYEIFSDDILIIKSELGFYDVEALKEINQTVIK